VQETTYSSLNLTNQDEMQEKLCLLKLATSDGILFFSAGICAAGD
jgi:hypothetical protein